MNRKAKKMKNPLRLVSRKSLRNIVGSFVLLTLASIIVIVLGLPGRNRKTVREKVELQERADRALVNSMGFGMEDFYLESQSMQDGIVYPLRQPRRFWSREVVDSYWIDPADAGLQTLTEDNDRLILESLGVSEDEQP